ncbi:MAG: TIGR00730 family Rossman fold protein [Candidatus Sumerlaeaceae bacterium]|nr:TIGR00730 family Rossman fold protein [Candidatus Sumerlaeaceae bacterium]
MKRVCVFCGSSAGERPVYAQAARELGRVLAERGIGMVYGGGNVGLMGIAADAALAAGGEVIGVIPKALRDREIAHPRLTKLHVVGSMHERKALMSDLSDGFIAMPGGFGTLDEFMEVLTWAQLGIHRKPCGLLNVDNFFAPLLTLLDRAVADRFLRPQHRALVLVASKSEELLDRMAAMRTPVVDRWLDRGMR